MITFKSGPERPGRNKEMKNINRNLLIDYDKKVFFCPEKAR